MTDTTATATETAKQVHILHVRPDPDYPDEHLFTVTCPYEPADMKRPCVLWWECMSHPDGTRDDLDEGGGEGPCDEAEADIGHHEVLNGMVAHPSRECIVAKHDSLVDNARDLELPVGDHAVDVEAEDWDCIHLVLVSDTQPGGER